MSRGFFIILLVLAVVLILYVTYQHMMPQAKSPSQETARQIELEKSCLGSGGQVVTATCCQSSGDFPDSCLISACGCSAAYSHQIKICECSQGKCFDGEECI